MIELKDTVELMCSDDWRKRLVAEYAQAVIRHKNLEKTIREHGLFEPKDRILLAEGNYLDDYMMSLSMRVEEVVGVSAFTNNVEEWIYNSEPLTIFDFDEPKEELIKIERIPGEPRLEEGLNGWFYVAQKSGDRGIVGEMGDWKTFCNIEGPIANKANAIKEWNKLALKMNGDK